MTGSLSCLTFFALGLPNLCQHISVKFVSISPLLSSSRPSDEADRVPSLRASRTSLPHLRYCTLHTQVFTDIPYCLSLPLFARPLPQPTSGRHSSSQRSGVITTPPKTQDPNSRDSRAPKAYPVLPVYFVPIQPSNSVARPPRQISTRFLFPNWGRTPRIFDGVV